MCSNCDEELKTVSITMERIVSPRVRFIQVDQQSRDDVF